jgi:NADH:ubiquinone oxidoreductase subunit E
MPAHDSTMQKQDKGCSCPEPSEQELLARLEEVVEGLSKEDGALIPALQSAQNMIGYLPKSALQMISRKLDIPYSEVAGVVTFYSFFSTVPRGRNIVRVCLGTACYVRGGKEVLASLQSALGIGVGQTSEDREFTLEIGRCFGACGLAPVVMVNEDVHQRVKPAKVKEMLAPYMNQQNQPQEETV